VPLTKNDKVYNLDLRLFYDGDLIPLAPPEIQDRFLGVDFLPNKVSVSVNKTFFTSSQAERQNRREYLSLANLSSLI
jgi:hypothetical protein